MGSSSAAAPTRRRSTVTPEPSTTISRQPSRSANDAVRERDRAPPRRAAPASGAANPQTERIVEQAAGPGREGQPGLGQRERQRFAAERGGPATRASVSQAATRPASVSASESSPSPSVSKPRRAWKAGISAWSMTTSSRIAVGLDPQAGVVVDREVAERMRGDERRAARGPRGVPRPARQPSRPHGVTGRSTACRRSSVEWHHRRQRPCPFDRARWRRAASHSVFVVSCARGSPRLSGATIVRYTPGVEHPGAPHGGGWFITIEGPDGAGKTTQAEALARPPSRTRARPCYLTREPGGTWLGERLRELLLARTGSAARDRSAHGRVPVQRGAPPAGRRRSSGRRSTRGRDRGLRPVRRFDARLPGLRRRRAARSPARARRRSPPMGCSPHLTILLDLPVEAGLARKAPGDVTRFEAEFDLAFHRRVRDGFLALAAAEARAVRGRRRDPRRPTRWRPRSTPPRTGWSDPGEPKPLRGTHYTDDEPGTSRSRSASPSAADEADRAVLARIAGGELAALE